MLNQTQDKLSAKDIVVLCMIPISFVMLYFVLREVVDSVLSFIPY